MPWSQNTRTNRPGGRAWQATRQAVAARAHGRCEAVENGQRCQAPGTDAHHIGDRNNHHIDNLAWLCAPHHARITKAQAAHARQRPQATRPPEPHPGLT